jgi:hypothetical protein
MLTGHWRGKELGSCSDGVSVYPTAGWVSQQARQFAWSLGDRPVPAAALIRDRDAKFAAAFDEVFRTEGLNVITTPIQAPKANAYAERFVGTVRRECLDWLLITGQRHLERVLRTYLVHYDTHRPHRSLELTPPQASPTLRLAAPPSPSGIKLARQCVMGQRRASRRRDWCRTGVALRNLRGTVDGRRQVSAAARPTRGRRSGLGGTCGRGR